MRFALFGGNMQINRPNKTNKEILRQKLDRLDKEVPEYRPLTTCELIFIVIAALFVILTVDKWLPAIF